MNKRKDLRFELRTEVAFRSVKIELISHCRNLSEKGMFVEMLQPIAVGQNVRVSFVLPRSNQTLNLEGIVRWNRCQADGGGQRGVGIEFYNVSEDNKNHIESELNRLDKDAAQAEPVSKIAK